MLFTKEKIIFRHLLSLLHYYYFFYQGDVFQNKWEKGNALYCCIYLTATFMNVSIYTFKILDVRTQVLDLKI